MFKIEKQFVHKENARAFSFLPHYSLALHFSIEKNEQRSISIFVQSTTFCYFVDNFTFLCRKKNFK